MDKYAVIVGGGTGVRMGSSLPKQFLLLQGKPVLWHTLQAFLTAFDDLQIILVLPADYIETGQTIVADLAALPRVQIIAGGETRFQSVKNGLQYIKKNSVVFVHDAVRCVITPGLIQRCYQASLEKGNAIPAVTANESVRIITENGNQGIDRDKLRIIQTPQTFLSGILLKAFELPYQSSFTDEASVVEQSGIGIHLVKGEISNIKITHPLDLLVAEKLLAARSND